MWMDGALVLICDVNQLRSATIHCDTNAATKIVAGLGLSCVQKDIWWLADMLVYWPFLCVIAHYHVAGLLCTLYCPLPPEHCGDFLPLTQSGLLL